MAPKYLDGITECFLGSRRPSGDGAARVARKKPTGQIELHLSAQLRCSAFQTPIRNGAEMRLADVVGVLGEDAAGLDGFARLEGFAALGEFGRGDVEVEQARLRVDGDFVAVL